MCVRILRAVGWTVCDWLADWLSGWTVCDWLADCLDGQCVTDWLTVWLTVWMDSVWLTGWLSDWLSGWTVCDWLSDCLTDCLNGQCVTDWLTDWLSGWTVCDWLTDWETNSSLASQEIWNIRVRYRVHNSLSLVPILSEINPIHVLPSLFSKVYFNTSFPSMPLFPKWSPSTQPYKHFSPPALPPLALPISAICHTAHNVTNRSTGGPGSNFDYPQNSLSWVYSACPCRMWGVSNQATILRLYVYPSLNSKLSWHFTQNTLLLCYWRFGITCRCGPVGCPETTVTNYQSARDFSLPARIAENCAPLGYRAASNDDFLLTFRDYLLVLFSGINNTLYAA